MERRKAGYPTFHVPKRLDIPAFPLTSKVELATDIASFNVPKLPNFSSCLRAWGVAEPPVGSGADCEPLFSISGVYRSWHSRGPCTCLSSDSV